VSASEGRFEAVRSGRLTGFVGREHELGLLVERWNLAQDGEGQVVLLSGEPGIGKSRILRELRGRLERAGACSLRFHCSPYFVNSAFYPIIDNFERALRFARDDTTEQKLGKLEALIVGQYSRPREDLRFIAAMLSIPCEERHGAVAMTPQKFKDETLRSLVDTTEAIARRQPTVELFEDIHWADPTTLEAIDLLIHRVKNIPLSSCSPTGRSFRRAGRIMVTSPRSRSPSSRSPRLVRWYRGLPAARRYRRICSIRSSARPTACRFSSRS
jgi:predicted ATPase